MIKTHLETLLKAGWSQAKIAEATGIHGPCISRIMAGKQKDVHYTEGKKLEALALAASVMNKQAA